MFLYFNFYIMKTYKDTDNDSWVIAYEYWDDYITIKFSSWSIYKYTTSSAWVTHLNEMKRLADLWDWLNAYLNKNKPWFLSKN